MPRWTVLAAGLVIGSAAVTPLAAVDGLEALKQGSVAFRGGDYAGAVRLFGAALEAGTLDPARRTVAHTLRAVAEGNLGDFEAAVDDYAQAIRLAPGSPLAYTRRGVAYTRLGDHDRAIADYRTALRLQPDNAIARDGLERALRARGGTASVPLAALGRPAPPAASPPPAAPSLAPAPPPLASSPSRAAAARVAATLGRPAEPPGVAPRAPSPLSVRRAPRAYGLAARVPARGVPPVGSSATEPPPAVGEADSTPYVARSDVNVRTGPGNRFPAVGVLTEGTRVGAFGERLGWRAIVLPDGRRGYVYERFLRPVS